MKVVLLKRMKIEAIKFINNPSAHNLLMFYRFGTAISFTAHLFLLLLLLINGIGTKAGRLLNPEPEPKAPAIDAAEACANKVRLFSERVLTNLNKFDLKK